MTNMQVELLLVKHSSQLVVGGQEEFLTVTEGIREGGSVVLGSLASAGAAVAPASRLKYSTVSQFQNKLITYLVVDIGD